MKTGRWVMGGAVMLAATTAMAAPAALPNMEGKAGVGLSSSLLNFGFGPMAEYWVTKKYGVSGSLGMVGDFTTYGVRGLMLFDKAVPLGTMVVQPYAAAGFSIVEEDFSGVKFDGSGIEIAGGVQKLKLFDNPNLLGAVEAGFSMVTTEATVDFCGGACPTKVEGDYGGFSIGGKVVYYFDR